MVHDTHKFESRYLDRLVGQYPKDEAVYRERSPIFHLDRFKRPVILLQGLEDKVVPPNQAELILESLKKTRRARGLRPLPWRAARFPKSGKTSSAPHETELYFLLPHPRIRIGR